MDTPLSESEQNQAVTGIFKRNKKIFLLFFSIFVLTVISVFLLGVQTNNKQRDQLVKSEPSIQPEIPIEQTNKEKIINAPKVYFENYKNNSALISAPSFLRVYSLKYNFKKEEIISFANKLGLDQYKENNSKNENVAVYNVLDKDKRGIAEFDKNSGSFFYQSFGILKPENYAKGQSEVFIASSFLKELGFDDTVACTNTYERKDNIQNITYVECHRDWTKTGLPVINLGGVLNIAENQKILNLSAGEVDKFSPLDTGVVNLNKISGGKLTAENSNGRARPNDFNTITFGIAKDGRILTIDSRLRFIDKEITLDNKDLITPKDALNVLKNHKYQYALTLPAGSGATDFNKVYEEDNVASGKEAEINEISLVYLDRPFDLSQERYAPFYIVRGIANLNTGYNVKFAQVVPALRSELSIVNTTSSVAGEKSSVAGAKTFIAQKRNIQLDTFYPSGTVEPTTTTTPVPVKSEFPDKCINQKGGEEVSLNIPGYGTLNVIVSGSAGGSGHTFFYKSSTLPNKSRAAVLDAFFQAVEEQYVINLAYYVKDHSLTISSVEDIYKIYDEINRNTNYKEEIFYPRPAPVLWPNPTFNKETAKRVYENVAKRILSAKQKGEINALTQKSDLFPEETIMGLEGVFFDISVYGNKSVVQSPCYISGLSPVIYFYPTQTTKISVQTGAPLIYSDPSISSNIWNIISSPDGTINQGGIKRNNLYYEYDKSKVVFSEPSTGFIIKTDQWKDFIKNNLSQKLGLNSKETESLIVEIQNSLIGTQRSQYLKLSLIPKSELNKKLPLTINPKPDNIYRINIFIKPLNTYQSIQSPKINQIKRNGFTVVEVGAYSE
ncbi:MAG: hypothetical protein M1450_05060 [Patescibacteria group bacterium]|nr:hypothetical protein [Patescibacteria group bacterium]